MSGTRRPLKRTPLLRVLGLAAAGFVFGRLTPPMVVRADGEVPRISWVAAVLLALLAAMVGWLAWSTYQSLHKKRERMTSPHAIRMLAFAKACIIGGALIGGYYAGFAVAHVDAWYSELGRERVIYSAAAAVGAVLLVVAAAFLERACELPEDDDEDGGTRSRSSRTSPEPT